ncbi:hypothetical protein [Acinetobacter baumannii]|jgi:hypothetical protein|uniref:hypothetical protein n=1 Tax=Acinetobacter baumannii TaxID=470 RepID=UPI000D69F0A0|nr:hypothetical protein [Acinetobacter baumannii]MBI1413772.1 hypothetical protein [Acinetobacter baumannii]MBI1429000.1 hypothetical protein [Acinetobacter baumannii]MVM70656.1 hypothetical protein [Acinetobacter baumannii]QLI36178.1 hypothetical protein HLG75_09140 [Acinetobacter baumannii]HCQ9559091.1 hypothetical protein [Acinetobacter baumannii]
MKDKTLEQKVKYLKLSAILGFFVFLIVGILIKSTFFSSTPKATDFYELFRDGLTITAYYLAPAAALLLFSDWRKEHVEKSRESQGKEIYDLIYQLDYEISNLRYESDEKEAFTKEGRKLIERKLFEIQHQIYRLDKLIFDFEYDDENSKEFKSLGESIQKAMQSMHTYLGLMFSSLVRMNNPEEFMGEYINDNEGDFVDAMEREYDGYFQDFIIDAGKVSEMKKQVKTLKDALKVNVKSPN